MPLIASRAADSAFALGFGKASSSLYTSWFPSLVYNSSIGSEACIDSSGNSYVTINFGVRTIVQKISVTGTIIWEKIVGTTGFDVVKSFIVLSPDETTLYIAQNTGRLNGANWCIELNSIYTNNGTLRDIGYVYNSSGILTNLKSFTYNPNATDSKKLVFVIDGYRARDYSTTYSTNTFFVNPNNFSSYRQSTALANSGFSGYIAGYCAVILNGGTTFTTVNSSLYGYGIIGTDVNGNSTGSIKLPGLGTSICTISIGGSNYAYCDFSTGSGKIGIAKISNTFVVQWAKEITVTDASVSPFAIGRNLYVDYLGNVYCAVTFQNGATNNYIIVFKMDANGNFQWIKKFISTYGTSTSGGLYASSICGFGASDFLTIGGLFSNNNYAFGLTLKTNGSNIDGTYVGNSSTGNMIVSTPAYTISSPTVSGSLPYVTVSVVPIDTVQTTNASSNTISVGVTPVLLPYS